MRKPSNIFIVISALFLLAVHLCISSIEDDFLQSLVKFDSATKENIHLDKGNYIVHTSTKNVQGKCFALTGEQSNINYEFTAVSRKGFIFASTTTTIDNKIYYNQGHIYINEADSYEIRVYDTSHTYILENTQMLDSLFEKIIMLTYLWYLAIFLLVVSILLKVILLIKKHNYNAL